MLKTWLFSKNPLWVSKRNYINIAMELWLSKACGLKQYSSCMDLGFCNNGHLVVQCHEKIIQLQLWSMLQTQTNEFCLEPKRSQAKHVPAKYEVPAWICMTIMVCNISHLIDESQEEWLFRFMIQAQKSNTWILARLLLSKACGLSKPFPAWVLVCNSCHLKQKMLWNQSEHGIQDPCIVVQGLEQCIGKTCT